MASAVGREVEGASPSPETNGAVAQLARAPEVMIPEVEGSNPSSPTKLYAVVDSKLSNGAKACQAAHALRAFVDNYPDIERTWWEQSNTLVLLETFDLISLELRAKKENVSCVRFVEPDWAPEGTLTALVLGPEGKRLVRGLNLAFSES